MKQYELFPMNYRRNNIELVMDACDAGQVKLAIGKIYCYNCGHLISWDSILCLDEEEAREIQFEWKYAPNHFLNADPFAWVDIKNWDELCRKYNISMLREHDKEYFYTSHRIVCISNMHMIDYVKQFVNSPEVLGEWTTDYGGYGSRVYNPFEFAKESLQTLGLLYEGSLFGEREWRMYRYVANMYLKKYLQRYNLEGKTVVHAEGNYCGRPGCNSWNTGLGETKETLITGVESLKEFAYLGFRCLKIY